ncbi:hypothetical protein EG835_14480 [bacterium]|nr:hypothetical protein [bacterium]
MAILVKTLVGIGSAASIGFGLWHFTVPATWKWYSYMDPAATELVLAVRATNIFFSLALVLFGLVNLLLVFGDRSNAFSVTVVLTATCVLWLTRVVLQVVYPQGTLIPALQYGMLAAFVVVFVCYAVALLAVVARGGTG